MNGNERTAADGKAAIDGMVRAVCDMRADMERFYAEHPERREAAAEWYRQMTEQNKEAS